MTGPSVIEVSEDSFEREVLDRSETLPVVVDFWAPWCGPCRFLGPVLERLAEGEFKGSLVLAKVNTDEAPQLATDYRIQGIPAVKAFRNRRLVAEFVGALPEDQVRNFLQSLLPSQADRLAAQGAELERSGDGAQAEARYRAAIGLDRLHPAALAGLGRVLEARGDLEGALDAWRRVPAGAPESAEAERKAALLALKHQAAAAGDEASLQARVEAAPKDTSSRYALGLALAARGEHRRALEHLLEVVRLDRKLDDDGARQAMLRIFEAVGPRSELADEFRSRLASILY